VSQLFLPIKFILPALQYGVLLESGLAPQAKEASPGQQI
jgi:hypothetical protein